MKRLSIIIPCFNERATIEELLRRVNAVSFPEWEKEIIVVDDGSTDGTREILKEYAKRGLNMVYHEKNLGKGSAVARGIREGTGDYFIIQDADLEYNPEEIGLLLDALQQGRGDVIYGSRNLSGEKRGLPFARLGVWLITKLLNWLYGLRLTDAWTCYKLFPRAVAREFRPGGFESELLFTAAIARQGLHIAEVPISHHQRSWNAGKKIRYRDGLRAMYLLLRDRLRS